MNRRNLFDEFSARIRVYIIFMFICILFASAFSPDTTYSQETVAVIQPGNKTLEFTNMINQPVIAIRVKHSATPVNGDYVILITSKSPTRATVEGNSETTIIADGSTWNELIGLEGVEIIFDQGTSLEIGDKTLVSVENGPEGKDNIVSLRINYPYQESYRVYNSGGLWCMYNTDGGHTRSLLYFDLMNIPPTSTLVSADIYIFCVDQWYRWNNLPNAGLILYPILRSWEEGTGEGINNATINGVTGYERWYGDNKLTGNPEDWAAVGLKQGTDYDNTVSSLEVLFSELGPPNIPGYVPNKFAIFDVTQIVQGWLDGTYVNHGVLLKGNDIADNAVYGIGAGYSQFWNSSEHINNTTQRPRLIVKYIKDTTPPEINVTVTPDILWPPNHKLVTIYATVSVSDNCDPDPDWELVSVVSNEPEDEPNKKHYPDIIGAEFGTKDTEFELRAERLGKGDSRIYTITYQATDLYGNSASVEATVTVPHDMGNEHASDSELNTPESCILLNNYPNPFNPETEIRFQIPVETNVTLKVYNILGAEIRTLVKNRLEAGRHSVQWDGKNDAGAVVSSGLYLFVLRTDDFCKVHRALLLR